MREPNFDNLLKVLHCQAPDRPTLFELFLNARVNKVLAGPAWTADPAPISQWRLLITTFKAAGYDYATVGGSSFRFPGGEHGVGQTISLNQGAVITDRRSFDAYDWPNPDDFDYSLLKTISPDLPKGMRLIVSGPLGVLENVISLVGYDNLCFMLADDPALATDVFAAVGSRLVRHFDIASAYETVGACIACDDWGFKTQTLLSVADLRKYVFPWHERIVAAIHAAGKPAILHSCGYAEEIMEDVITGMRYDGKHSFEDVIMPIEDAYRRWGGRIALLGGIDLDFIVRSSQDQIRARCLAMLKLAERKGGYALGTGNSVPEYIDDDKFFAMAGVVTGHDSVAGIATAPFLASCTSNAAKSPPISKRKQP